MLALAGCATQPMPEILPVAPPPADQVYAPAPSVLADSTTQSVVDDKRAQMQDAELMSLRQELLDLRREIVELRHAAAQTAAPALTPALPARQTAKASTAKKPSSAGTKGPKSIIPAAAAEPAITPTAGGTVAIHLGSYRSPELAREGWRTVLKNNPTVLGPFTPKTMSVLMGNDQTRHYQLLVGPLGTKSEAEALCRKLKESAGFCSPATFGGTAVPQ